VTRAGSGPLLSPGFWLQQGALSWRAELDTRLRPLGLTPTQFNVLASVGWLEHLSGPPTQQQVAEQAAADRMMTSKVAHTLEQHGLLSRQAHEADTRALRLARSFVSLGAHGGAGGRVCPSGLGLLLATEV